jgi:hypothetical protein
MQIWEYIPIHIIGNKSYDITGYWYKVNSIYLCPHPFPACSDKNKVTVNTTIMMYFKIERSLKDKIKVHGGS